MTKKIILTLFLFVSLFWGVSNWFAEWSVCNSTDCLNSSTFEIKVNDTIWIGFSTNEEFNDLSDSKQKINFVLWTIIQKLMIALWVLSVLIMTVGWGYIIMYHWQDELLSKGKSIFMSGVIALVVALSSYYIVSALRFILYN